MCAHITWHTRLDRNARPHITLSSMMQFSHASSFDTVNIRQGFLILCDFVAEFVTQRGHTHIVIQTPSLTVIVAPRKDGRSRSESHTDILLTRFAWSGVVRASNYIHSFRPKLMLVAKNCCWFGVRLLISLSISSTASARDACCWLGRSRVGGGPYSGHCQVWWHVAGDVVFAQ